MLGKGKMAQQADFIDKVVHSMYIGEVINAWKR